MSDKQTLSFQTEVKQLLNLMIHSLYSNSEIFLRELISNASDAIDKLRFEQVSQANLKSDTELAITISLDTEAKTLTISDNGIGMNYDEVIKNIGTIANSGTKAFMEKLTGDNKKDANLIGQFGVGFYSAFIVANKVELITLKAGLDENEAVKWVSEGLGEYSIEATTKDRAGTDIILHLKDTASEFNSAWTIRSLVRKYSDHINYPIKMLKEEVDKDGKPIASDELEVVNKANALWVRNKNEISQGEYQEFYKTIAHDYQDPLKWVHAKVEGTQEYTQLLYIPSQAPFDLYDQTKRHGIKLYIKRVFIMDDAEKLLPNYLRFVRGIIDTQDLPLNVSREILQSSKDIDSIRTGSTKKILNLLEDMVKNEPETYTKFWNEFGNVLKEGVIEDHANKDKIASLLRFTSTNSNNQDATVSLDDYIARMQTGQDKIYYITADTYNTAKNSPHLELFKQKQIEVLLLTNRVDEWLVGHLTKYKDVELISVAKGSANLDKLASNADTADANKTEDDTNSEENTIILDKLKEILKDKVKEVKSTKKLVTSPSCLVVDDNAMSIHMQRILKQAGQEIPDSKPSLEINLSHPLLKRLSSIIEQDSEEINNLAWVVYDQAALTEGLTLDDPAGFIARMNSLLVDK